MQELYLVFTIIGGLIVFLGIFSALIKNRLPVSVPLLAMLIGIGIGPNGLNFLDPCRWQSAETILEEAARLTLAIGLMAVALRLPPRYFLEHRRTQMILIGIIMPLMWLASSFLAWLFLGLPATVAFLLGAIVTPTDPIVASSIVTSESAKRELPDRLRHALSGESGLNDGLAYLFVLLPVLLLAKSTDVALRHWLLSTLLHEVVGAVILGLVVGYGAGRLLRWAEDRETIEPVSFLGYTVALALLILGGAKLLGTDGVLAVFIAGVAFDNAVGGKERAEEENIQEMVNQFFSIPIFALFGLMLPTEEWLRLGWQGIALAVAILGLRRLPAALGFSFFTLTITYFLSVYSALQRRNTLASILHHMTSGEGTARRYIVSLGAGGNFSATARDLSDLAARTADLVEAHTFYPVVHYFHFRQLRYALPRMALLLLDTATLVSTLPLPGGENLRASASQLDTAVRDLLERLAATFHTGHAPEDFLSGKEDEETWKAHYGRIARELREAGIPPAAEEAMEEYLTLRRQWHPFIAAFSASLGYEMGKVVLSREPN